MTNDQVVEKIKLVYKKRAEIISLAKQREAEETALVEEYKVNECNAKRNVIALRYANLNKVLQLEAQAIEKELMEA